MRPATNFTLHAILAACLVAFAAASAAAGKMDAWIMIGGINGEEGDRAQQGSQGQQLEVQSYHWGPRQTTSADGSRTRAGNQVILDDTPGGAAAKERQAGMKDMAAERSGSEAGGGLDAGMKQLEAKDRMGDSRSGHSMLGASDRVTHNPPPPRDGGLGSESERRNYAPVKFATPRDRGSLTFAGAMPGCEVGKRYAGAQFAAGAMRYELTDVVITNCSANGVSLNYGKVKVRGWNPEKKEL